MASPIIAALRNRTDLKESTLHTLTELAHLASIYGVVKAPYTFIAQKSRCSPRTAIRHIHIGETVGIVQVVRQKRIVRRKDLPSTDPQYSDDSIRGYHTVMRNEINQYRFLIKWDQFSQRAGSSNRVSDKMTSTLPPQEREKNLGVREELKNQQNWLRKMLPGTDRYAAVQERIQYLETCLRT